MLLGQAGSALGAQRLSAATTLARTLAASQLISAAPAATALAAHTLSGVGGSLGLLAAMMLSEASISSLYSTLTAALGSSALTVQPVTAMRRSAAARAVYTGPTALPASTATFAVVASA